MAKHLIDTDLYIDLIQSGVTLPLIRELYYRVAPGIYFSSVEPQLRRERQNLYGRLRTASEEEPRLAQGHSHRKLEARQSNSLRAAAQIAVVSLSLLPQRIRPSMCSTQRCIAFLPSLFFMLDNDQAADGGDLAEISVGIAFGDGGERYAKYNQRENAHSRWPSRERPSRQTFGARHYRMMLTAPCSLSASMSSTAFLRWIFSCPSTRFSWCSYQPT